MKKNLLKYNIVILLLTLLACSRSSDDEKQMNTDAIIPVKIQQIVSSNKAIEIETSGYFTSDDETQLSFKIGGVISKIYAKEGDAIHAGQTLASIIPTEIDAQVKQTKLALQKAERDFERAKKLYKDSVATLEQFQNAKTAFELAKQVNNSANFNQNYTKISASKQGFVLKKLASEGQIIGPGMPVLIVNGANKSNWLLKVGLSDKQWSKVKIGDVAEITCDALPKQVLKAKVANKSKSINLESGTFDAELKLENPLTTNIATGMFANAKIKVKTNNTSTKIPYDALIDAGENAAFVFIADKGVAKKIKVELGAMDKEQIEIISGLENYSNIIVSGNAYLNDNSKIKVIK